MSPSPARSLNAPARPPTPVADRRKPAVDPDVYKAASALHENARRLSAGVLDAHRGDTARAVVAAAVDSWWRQFRGRSERD